MAACGLTHVDLMQCVREAKKLAAEKDPSRSEPVLFGVEVLDLQV